MDLTMSVAMTATSLKQADMMNKVSMKVLDKAIDTQKAQSETLIEGMTEGVPSFNHLLDTRA